MSSPRLARTERAALCDLMEQVGPDAPTLCEGWTTLDLAAHLVVRERRPDSGPGLLIPALSGWTEKVRTSARSRGYATLVEQVRQGPPVWSPMKLADAAINAMEYFIHHEDVRRAQPDWEPRELSAEQEDELWKRVAGGSKLTLRRAPVGVVLERPDGTSVTAKSGDPSVVVSGPAGEIALFISGRKGASRVELRGEPEAVEKLRSAQFGL